MTKTASKGRIVIGVIGDDIHVVGNRIAHLALEESGYTVFNLRTRNRPKHFVGAALETNADAVFVSSLNGEGEHWCANLRERFAAVGLADVLLYVGGNIIVGHRPLEEVTALFQSFGFDRVYHQVPDIGVAIEDLDKDIVRRSERVIQHGAA
ncbi:MAG: methylaspartate mutase subunit S [Gammaproteobacteria bacterium]